MRIILSHRYLDFDALASMIAAQRLFPDAVLVMEGEVSSTVQDFLALAKEQLPFQRWRSLRQDEITEVILVDTNDFRKTSLKAEAVSVLQSLPLRVYDHHPFAGERTQNICIEPVGATVTLLVERLAALGDGNPISGFEATLMMLGIYDDTGSLLFENTTPRDVAAAAFLLRNGAQLSVVAEYLHAPLNPHQLILFQQLLDHGSVEKFKGVPVYISFAEDKGFTGGLALLAHRIGEIESADVWFILVSMAGRVHIVARSRHAQVSVNRIMEVFGGAGHLKAASATVKNHSLRDVHAQLRLEIARWVQEPQTARDIMSFPVKTVTSDTKMDELGRILLRNGHTGMPVADEGVLLGIISRRDIDKALRYELGHAPVKGYMSREVVTVEPEATWEEVQQCMIDHDIGRVLVVDKGNLVGIITRSDVLRLIYGRSLPTARQLALDRGMAMSEDVCERLAGLDGPARAVIEAVSAAAEELGLGVYLVGGFVRDLLLNKPTQDIDVVVEGQAVDLARFLCERDPTLAYEVYGQFGTARVRWLAETDAEAGSGKPESEVVISDREIDHIDIAGSRSEIYDSPGALPTVERSTLRDDLFRRDFTINAMAICLNRDRYGELIDYYGGMRDLQQKEIRILHNLSFIDDPLRMLRAMRFAGRYGFCLARSAFDAVQTALREKVVESVSAERFSEELLLVVAEDAFALIWKKLADTGVLRAWFRADYPWRVQWGVEERTSESWPAEMRLLALMMDLTDGQVADVLRYLKLSRLWRKDIMAYVAARDMLRLSVGTLEAVDGVMMELPLWLGDVLALSEDLSGMMSAYRRAVAGMDMRLTGHDLIQRGVPEGPLVGRLLKQIRARWLEGRILTFEDENSYLESLLSTIRKEV